MPKNQPAKSEEQHATTPTFDQKMIKPFTVEDPSEQTILKAIFTEEYHTTKTEIMTNCPPLDRLLATRRTTTTTTTTTTISPHLHLTTRTNAMIQVFYEIKSVFLKQVRILEALEIESLMFEDVLSAGVAMHGWLLQPIKVDLEARLARLPCILGRIHVLGHWAVVVADRVMIAQMGLGMCIQRAEEGEMAAEVSMTRKRAFNEVEDEDEVKAESEGTGMQQTLKKRITEE
jgi:hypothetical protein